MDNDIINKIKGLQKIHPNEAWKESLRQELLIQLESRTAFEKKDGFVVSLEKFAKNYIFSLKHAYVPVLIFLLVVFWGSVLAAQMANDSLPGEWLYNLKIASERAQISLTMNETSKIRKEVNFASRRLEELNTIVEKVDAKETQEVLENFQQKIVRVQTRLNEPEDSSRVVEMAKIVDQKVLEFEDTLTQAIDKVAPEARKAILAALNTLNDVNFKALGIIVDEQIAKGEIQNDEALIAKLENKIEKLKKRINSLEKSEGAKAIASGNSVIDDTQGLMLELGSQVQTAKVFLQEARELLRKKELKMALEKIEESSGLASRVEELAVSALKTINRQENPLTRDYLEDKGVSESQINEQSKYSQEVIKETTTGNVLEPTDNSGTQDTQDTKETYPQHQKEVQEHDFYGGIIKDNSAKDSQFQGGILKTREIAP